jgi:threonine synthase
MRDTYLCHLRCSATGATFTADRLQGLSPAGKPLLCDYDLEALRGKLDRDALERRRSDMWRWRELLPLPLGIEPRSLGEGGTPLLSAARLGAELGLRRLWVKDESGNPTGSFKARGLSAAVHLAAHLGARAFVAPSAGNAGGALAAYAARFGLPCHVFVPADTPELNQLEVVLHGGTLVRVDGLIDECGRRAAAARDELGAFDVSTLKEPYRIEGKKTMGLELAQQLGWRMPDVVVYPAGGGTGLIGVHKAFLELRALGFLPSGAALPRFVAVQASGCAPIVKAFASGAMHATKVEGAHTVASGLRVPSAVGDFLMLDILRTTGGTALAVEDAALLDGMRRLARAEGIAACPEGGACVAAIAALRHRGAIAPDEEVVLFNTGTGLKYLEVLRRLDVTPP